MYRRRCLSCLNWLLWGKSLADVKTTWQCCLNDLGMSQCIAYTISTCHWKFVNHDYNIAYIYWLMNAQKSPRTSTSSTVFGAWPIWSNGFTGMSICFLQKSDSCILTRSIFFIYNGSYMWRSLMILFSRLADVTLENSNQIAGSSGLQVQSMHGMPDASDHNCSSCLSINSWLIGKQSASKENKSSLTQYICCFLSLSKVAMESYQMQAHWCVTIKLIIFTSLDQS